MKLQKARSRVLENGWLSLQPTDFQERLLDSAILTHFEEGAATFQIGDAPGGLYGVVSGGFSISIPSRADGSVIAHVARMGTWFGHGPVLTRGSRTMTFRATTASFAFHVPLVTLEQLTREDPVAMRIVGSVSEHNITVACWALSDLLIPEASRRIVATLLRVTGVLEGNPPDNSKGYRLTQGDLGALANASRDLVNRTLAGLQKQGMVAVIYGHIAILDPSGLAGLAYRS